MSQLDFAQLDEYLLAQKSRIIHQVWMGTIPNKREAKKAYQKLKIYRDSWKIQNPTWFHIEWDKPMCLALVKSFYPEHMEMFKTYPYEIQRCDSIRYMILHRFGGVYADMDYYCNRPLDEALKAFPNDIYLVQTPNTNILGEIDHISNSLMYSVAGNPFWKQVLLELEKKQARSYYNFSTYFTIMYTTGPGILNRIYSKYKYKYKVKSLPHKLFHPYGIGDDKLSLTKNTEVFAIHLGKGSWEQKDGKYFVFLYREWRVIVFIILFLILPVLVTITRSRF